jgi:hypothetical protein
MTESKSTPFSKRCEILADLWVAYKGDEEMADFISYNDLGLPLAYAINTEIVPSTVKAELFIDETFELLLSGLELDDEGFDSLEDILGVQE